MLGKLLVFFKMQPKLLLHQHKQMQLSEIVKFRDVNGDGIITDADRTFQGVSIPKYGFGLNFSASYENFDFSMFWQGSGGNKVFNAMYRNLMTGQYGNHSTDELNYWTPTNTNTNVPRTGNW